MSVAHQHDIAKFQNLVLPKVNRSAEDENDSAECVDDEEDETSTSNPALSHQSAFILYNCARLHAILDKFENMVKKGEFWQNSL